MGSDRPIQSEKIVCADDGSFEHNGFVIDLIKNKLDPGSKFDIVFTCGPEIMMYNVFEICEEYHINCQVSLERYMRCKQTQC